MPACVGKSLKVVQLLAHQTKEKNATHLGVLERTTNLFSSEKLKIFTYALHQQWAYSSHINVVIHRTNPEITNATNTSSSAIWYTRALLTAEFVVPCMSAACSLKNYKRAMTKVTRYFN